MDKRDGQRLGLMLVVSFLAACTSSPTPTSFPTGVSLTAVSPTPFVTDSAPTNPPPTVVPSATAIPLPTMTPLTEDIETELIQENSNEMETNLMYIKVGETLLTATLVENSSVEALKQALSKGPITINMQDYGSMEKVGSLGMDLPQNNEQITTEAGDLILYQGSAFVIYYAPNSWNFTKLGKINHVTAEELKEILGNGNVSVALSLPKE